jgi:hypothetical protein
MATVGGSAPYAVTQRAQAVGTTSSPTTTSASLVALPDMTKTLTTAGGDLLCLLVATVSNSSAGVAISLAIQLDGGAAVSTEVASIPGASGAVCIACAWLFTGVAAGSHAVAGLWSASSGTATANGIERTLQVIEMRR